MYEQTRETMKTSRILGAHPVLFLEIATVSALWLSPASAETLFFSNYNNPVLNRTTGLVSLSGVSQRFATEFFTLANPATVRGAALLISNADTVEHDLDAWLYAADGPNSGPGTLLTAFTSADDFVSAGQTNLATFSHAGFTLNPNTQYWLVAGLAEPVVQSPVHWLGTSSNNADFFGMFTVSSTPTSFLQTSTNAGATFTTASGLNGKFALGDTAPAINRIWDSGGTSNLWSDGANWNHNIAPSNGNSLTFGSGARTTSYADYAALSVNELIFTNTAPAFTLHVPERASQPELTINGALTNSGTATQTLVADGATALGMNGGVLTINSATMSGPITLIAPGSATIFNEPGTGGEGGSTAILSSADSAQGGGTPEPGVVIFQSNATAATSTLTATGATSAAGFGGLIHFGGNTTAASANLFARSGQVAGAPGGTIFFADTAGGGLARATVEAGARFDISALTSPGMTIGDRARRHAESRQCAARCGHRRLWRRAECERRRDGRDDPSHHAGRHGHGEFSHQPANRIADDRRKRRGGARGNIAARTGGAGRPRARHRRAARSRARIFGNAARQGEAISESPPSERTAPAALSRPSGRNAAFSGWRFGNRHSLTRRSIVPTAPRPSRKASNLNPHHSTPMTPRILSATIAAHLALVFTVHAQTWDGDGVGGGNLNWNFAANWNPNALPVNNGTANVIFAGTIDTNGPNLDQNWSVNAVTFPLNAAANPFTLASSVNATLTVGAGGITNNDGDIQTVRHAVTIGTATSTFSSSIGTLTFLDTVNLGTNALTVSGVGDTNFANFSGAGSVTKTGAGTMNWAPTATTAADITVNAGTLRTTADGSTDVFDGNASIAVNGTSALGINEHMVLDGGAQLTRQAGASINLNSAKTLTVQGGSDAIFTGDFGFGVNFGTAPTVVVNGTGSTMQTLSGGNLSVLFSSALTVQSGAGVSAAGGLLLGSGGGNAMLTVDGTGSSVSAGALSVFGGGSNSTVTLSNNAAGNFAAIEIAEGTPFANVTTILSGADVITTGNLRLATFTAGGTGTLTVSGTGSTWTQTGVSSNTIGGSAVGGAAVVNVQNGAVFTSGTGSVTLNATATINISDGTLDLRGPLIRNGGALNFTSGALSIVDDFTVGAGGLLGTNMTLAATRRFTTSATTTIDPFQTLTLNGGSLSTGALVNNGIFAFNSGTLAITGAGGFNIGSGALGANVSLYFSQTLQVTNTATIAGGAVLAVNGGTFTAGALANSGTLRANSGAANFGTIANSGGGRIFVGDTLTASGSWTNAAGAQLTLENDALVNGAGALANSGLITGDGTIGKSLANNSGGEVRAAAGQRLIFTGAATNGGTGHVEVSAGGDLQFQSTLANASAIDVIGGTFRVEGATTNAASTGRITGRDAILRFNGGLANSGSLAFSFGTSDVFGDIANAAATGRIVVSGNSNATFYDDLVNNGSVQVSTGSTAVYFGAVSGTGSFPGAGTNFFEGDLSPGASPALVTFGGNVIYGSSATNTMELAGTARGTGYDAVNVAGKLTFNGTLTVPLLGGFTPQAGHVFNLFDWGTQAGAFTTVNLPALNAGLAWSQAALYTAGEIIVALDTAYTGRVWDGGGADNARIKACLTSR